MNNTTSPNAPVSPEPAAPPDRGFSPWQRLKNKRISYMTVPLLVMATVVEFVILATGWRYQQAVCLPQGMGVTFFGIGPIGATILAVELLKLPLAIWTASRQGWAKGFMLVVGLPLICVLTFQLVKDMAVYEMGTALAPATRMLEKASAEEIKLNQLNGELAAIEQKRGQREKQLAELAARRAKAKSEFEESLKHNEDTRHDAITLTDYQKKELSEVEARQAAIIKQCDADTEQLTKAIADLRARRETELGRATKWNAEEAKIENDYKAKMTEYANKKAAYDKARAEYDSAGFLKRQVMREPVSPGVPPEREVNTILKPTLVVELENQIKAKESELAAVNDKRRDRVAQVEVDARRLREEFDRRSSTKRDETDRKREEMMTAQTALAAQWAAEEKKIDEEFQGAAGKADGIRAEIDASRKRAESYYEAREAAIRNTQVHRIATTVEIVRGLIRGERPMSIKASAKERGDILTDQISMVRIWVYPVLAFIVAFLPTLMVEIGFSTVFKPEQQRPPHRLGFLGRNLHWLYIRAGRQKILRAERMAAEAAASINSRDAARAAEQAAAAAALAQKDAEVQAVRAQKDADVEAARAAIESAATAHQAELKQTEQEWVAKLAGMADTLNRTVVEKDTLRDLQKAEVERQVQMRQNAWSERLTQLRQELDDTRAAAEAERMALVQEHHQKLMEVSEDSKTQVIQARRQIADAELAAVESSARMTHDLKEAVNERDAAVAQLQQQSETFSAKLAQVREDSARELEKATRQEKHRLELHQLEFAKTLRQRDEDSEHQLQQREQELALAFEARLLEEKHKAEQESRRREAELERQMETRAREVDARWNQELQKREETVQIRLKQREQQVQAQAEVRFSELQATTAQELHRQKLEFERELDAQARDAAAATAEAVQKKELAFHARLKQREQELVAKAAARETELQNQWAADARNREQEAERQAESRVQAAETRLRHEAEQQEELLQTQARQRDQQWQAKLETVRSELQTQAEQALRRRDVDAEARQRDLEAHLRKEALQKVEAVQLEAKQHEQNLVAQMTAQAEVRLAEELQKKEQALHSKLKQREQELTAKAAARELELQNQWGADIRNREQEFEHEAETRLQAAAVRATHEAEQKEELQQAKARQRDQQWQARLEALRAELQAQSEQALRRREQETETRQRELETQLRKEMQQQQEAALAEAKQREQKLTAQFAAQAEEQLAAAAELSQRKFEEKLNATVAPLKTQLAHAEEVRDAALESASAAQRQVQHLEKKLTEASTFLNGWKNGHHLVVAGR